MTSARVSVCLAILLSCSIANTALAQTSDPLPGSSSTSNYGRFDPFDQTRLQFRSDIGNGVGYVKGYQTFGWFQPLLESGNNSLLFVNPRGIITYDGQFVGNVGGGYRYYSSEQNRVWGASFWYDHDNSGYNKYDQLGISLESLGKYFDVRLNGYVPTNSGTNVISQSLDCMPFFIASNIGIGRNTLVESPLRGGDFEVGGALPYIGDYGIRTYVGGYYLEGSTLGAAYGVKARAEALITRDLWAQIAVTNDKLFDTNVTGAITWYFPWNKPAQFFQRPPVQSRLYYQVERDYRIHIDRHVDHDSVLAINPATGLPFVVAHVDNTSAPGGDGTIEHPFSYLPTATNPNWNIVYVHRGTGTDLNMNQGITLQDNQRLLGEGAQHWIVSTQCTFLLPGTPGAFPTISNNAGNVVTLANNNEVSGFNINAPAGSGIVGNGIHDFNINQVNINNAAGAGILLNNVSGYGLISQAQLNNDMLGGLIVNNVGAPPLTLVADTISANGSGGGTSPGVQLIASASQINASLNNVTATGNSNGLELVANFGGVLNTLSTNNNFSFNAEDGVAIDGDAGGAVNLVSANDLMNSNLIHGIDVNLTNASAATLNLNGDSLSSNGSDSLIDGHVGSGLNINADGASVASFIASNSVFNNNNVSGIAVDLVNGSSLVNSTLQNSLVNDNVNGFGVGITATDSQVTNLQLLSNQINNNSGAGVQMTLLDTSVADGTLLFGNTIQANRVPAELPSPYTGAGIDIRLSTSAIPVPATAQLLNTTIIGNTIGSLTDANLGNDGSGIFMSTDQDTTIANLAIGQPGFGNIIARNGTVSSTTDAGIEIIRRDQSTVDNVTIFDNNISTNNGHGISLDSIGGSGDISDYTINNNLIASNTRDGVKLQAEFDASILANMDNNQIVSNGAHGIEVTGVKNNFLELESVDGTWTNNLISNNALWGIEITGITGLNPAGTPGGGLLIGQSTGAGVYNGGNLIASNGGGGIQVAPNVGNGLDNPPFPTLPIINNTVIENNVITANGASNTTLFLDGRDYGMGHGIEVRNNREGALQVSILNNVISEQTNGDGIHIAAIGSPGDGDRSRGAFDSRLTTTIQGNTIFHNAGRGILEVNAGNTLFTSSIGGPAVSQGNTIVQNGYEGILVINTADQTTVSRASSGGTLGIQVDEYGKTNDPFRSGLGGPAALGSAGGLNATPNMHLLVQHNNVTGNGSGLQGTIADSGLVILVGSSNGAHINSSGVVGDLAGRGDSNATFNGLNGGINALIDSNFFQGNAGADVAINSYRSSVLPTTGGTWNATTFQFENYVSNPLARMNLTFTNNVGEQALLSGRRPDSFVDITDGTWRNRTGGTTNTPPGPFGNATRELDIQQLAAFVPGFLTPATGGIEYDSLGASTFQVSSDSIFPGNGGNSFTLYSGFGGWDVVPPFAPPFP